MDYKLDHTEVHEILRKVFSKKINRELWLRTNNIIFDGARPEDLMETSEGLERVINELVSMRGH